MPTVKNTDVLGTLANNLTNRLREFVPDTQYAIIHEQLRQTIINEVFHHTGEGVEDFDKTEISPVIYVEAAFQVFTEHQVKGLRYNLAFNDYVKLVDYLPSKADKNLTISLGRDDEHNVTFEFLGKTTLK